MKVISIIGTSKTGKTTTACKVISELINRGYSVGSVKSIHFEQFCIDTEGTNTDKHKKAGAMPVTAWGLKETDIMFNYKMDIDKLLAFYDNDFVVIEGQRKINTAKIVTAQTQDDLNIIDENTIAICGVISNTTYTHPYLPVINAINEVSRLVDLIENISDYKLKNSN